MYWDVVVNKRSIKLSEADVLSLLKAVQANVRLVLFDRVLINPSYVEIGEKVDKDYAAGTVPDSEKMFIMGEKVIVKRLVSPE